MVILSLSKSLFSEKSSLFLVDVEYQEKEGVMPVCASVGFSQITKLPNDSMSTISYTQMLVLIY